MDIDVKFCLSIFNDFLKSYEDGNHHQENSNVKHLQKGSHLIVSY